MIPLLSSLILPDGVDTPKPTRLLHFDLARGVAIVVMLLQHAVLLYATPAEMETPLGLICLLAGTVPAAPVFMFVMGFGFTYGGRAENTWAALRRGLALFAGGYLLNVGRFTLPMLTALAGGMTFDPPYTPAGLLLEVDILQFAGLALVTMALLVRVSSRPIVWLGVAVATGLGAPWLWGLDSGFGWVDRLADPLWGTSWYVSFPLFPWLVFPLLGMVFGRVLRRVPGSEREHFFARTARACGVVMGLGLVVSLTAPEYHYGDYFRTRWGALLWYAAFVPVEAWFLGLLVRSPWATRVARGLGYLSRHVTTIYVIQWLLFGWGMVVLGVNRHSVGVALTAFLVVASLTLLLNHALDRLRAVWKTRRDVPSADPDRGRRPEARQPAG